MEEISSKRHISDNKQAKILLSCLIVELEISENLNDEAMERLDNIQNLLDSLGSAESEVYSAYYKARTHFYSSKNDVEQFYKNGLQYLSYAQLDLKSEEKSRFSFNLAISALIGEDIFNFGELVRKFFCNL